MLLSLPLLLLLSTHFAFSLANLPTAVGPNGAATLLAPVYRNVTADDVWVYPNSSFDLGARSMGCECFDPSETCCMPTSTTIAPFCIIQNTTCCANTYCLAGETCRGGFCCAAGTTCNVKLTGSGCCPQGEECSSFATCYDHASSNCSNTPSPKAGCCPVDTPYCRDFKPNGLGCYASNTVATSSLSTPRQLATSIQSSGTAKGTMPIIQGLNGMSLQFATNTGLLNAATTVTAVENPPVRGSATGSLLTVTPSSVLVTSLTNPSSSHAASTTEVSALCHNDDLQSPVSCQATPRGKATGSSSDQPVTTTSNIGFSPPGTSVYKSQASSLTNPFSAIFQFIERFLSVVFRLLALLSYDIAMSIESGAIDLGDYSSLGFAHYFLVLLILIPSLGGGFMMLRDLSRLCWNVVHLVCYGELPAARRQKVKNSKPAATLYQCKQGSNLPLPIQRRVDSLNLSIQSSIAELVGRVETLPPNSFTPTLQSTYAATLEETRSAFIDINSLLQDAISDVKSREMKLMQGSGRPLIDQSQSCRAVSPPQPVQHPAQVVKLRHITPNEDIHQLLGIDPGFSQAMKKETEEEAMRQVKPDPLIMKTNHNHNHSTRQEGIQKEICKETKEKKMTMIEKKKKKKKSFSDSTYMISKHQKLALETAVVEDSSAIPHLPDDGPTQQHLSGH